MGETDSRCSHMYRRIMQHQWYRQNVLKSMAVYGIFAVIGGIKGQIGPAFLDLQSISGVGLDEGSWIVTSLYIGYTLGALANGFLYHRCNSDLLFAVSALCLAAIVVAIPWCTVYSLMVACHASMGLVVGLIDAAGNAEIIRLWKTKSKTVLVGLHVIFNVGGVISPLIIAPFLMRKAGVTEERAIDMPDLTPISASERVNISLQLSTNYIEQNSTDDITQIHGHQVSRIHVAYLISSTFCVIHALWFVCLYFAEKKNRGERLQMNNKFSKRPQNSNEEEQEHLNKQVLSKEQKPIECINEQQLDHSYEQRFSNEVDDSELTGENQSQNTSGKCNRHIPRHLQILGLVVMVTMGSISNAIDFSFSTYLSSFCVEYLHWSKASGSMITSLLFIMVVMGGTLSMFLTKCVNSIVYIGIQIILILVSLLLLITSITLRFSIGVWLSAPLFGFAKSAIFPLVISWTNKSFIRVSGRVSSVFFVGAMGGCSINLYLLAAVMESMGKIWLCYILTLESGLLIMFFITAVLLSLYVKRRNRKHLG
ncbi:uncharacterized protein LOC117343512 isoform X2 [Pecten maximus]|nr:uncharacterized protein LOC117343512 isoform X2 [Pecten maximus]